MTAAPHTPVEEHWLEQTVLRLTLEFAGRRSAGSIRSAARACADNLRHAGVPTGALPELVERSARERLTGPLFTAADQAWSTAVAHWSTTTHR